MLLLLTSCISSARIAFVAPKILYSHKFLVELDLCYSRKYMEGCLHSTFPDFCGQGGIHYKVFERASLEFIYIHVIGAQVSSESPCAFWRVLCLPVRFPQQQLVPPVQWPLHYFEWTHTVLKCCFSGGTASCYSLATLNNRLLFHILIILYYNRKSNCGFFFNSLGKFLFH